MFDVFVGCLLRCQWQDPLDMDAGQVHRVGIYVQRVLPLTPGQAADKHIERRTVQPKTDAVNGGSKS